MTFSYHVGGNCILKCDNLPMQQGVVYEISGVENDRLRLFGGILSKVLPYRGDFLEWPQLQPLVADYTGTLQVEKGDLPDSGTYVGPDPEHHLFFTYVYEEIRHRAPKKIPEDILGLFGLEASLLNRRSATLSGGEKMKLALAIAMTTSATCYIVHGALAWLDQRGRLSLEAHIESKRAMGATIIIIEPADALHTGIGPNHFNFNGSTIAQGTDKSMDLSHEALRMLPNAFDESEHETLISVNNVAFSAYDGEGILKNVSCHIDRSGVFSLIGENGVGKSTLAKLMLRLLVPDGGEITLLRKPLEHVSRLFIRDNVTYLAQFPERQLTLGNIDQYRRQLEKEGNELALALLSTCLDLRGTHPISQLSALQLKMLVLITATSAKTRVLILDEPTWGLDQQGIVALFEFLSVCLSELQAGLLVISHDLTLLKRLNAKLWWLRDGVVEFFPNTAALMDHDLAGRYFEEVCE